MAASNDQIQNLMYDLVDLHRLRKATAATKGTRTHQTYTKLCAALKGFMSDTKQQTLPLPEGTGSVTIENKRVMKKVDESIQAFYPSFQAEELNRTVQSGEAVAFVQSLMRFRADDSNRQDRLTLDISVD